MSHLHNPGGSNSNVRSWKTEKGIKAYVKRETPDWVEETTEQYKLRKAEGKNI